MHSGAAPERLEIKPHWRQLRENGQHQTVKRPTRHNKELQTCAWLASLNVITRGADPCVSLMTCQQGVEPGLERKLTNPKRQTLHPCPKLPHSQSLLKPGKPKQMAGQAKRSSQSLCLNI